MADPPRPAWVEKLTRYTPSQTWWPENILKTAPDGEFVLWADLVAACPRLSAEATHEMSDVSDDVHRHDRTLRGDGVLLPEVQKEHQAIPDQLSVAACPPEEEQQADMNVEEARQFNARIVALEAERDEWRKRAISTEDSLTEVAHALRRRAEAAEAALPPAVPAQRLEVQENNDDQARRRPTEQP